MLNQQILSTEIYIRISYDLSILERFKYSRVEFINWSLYVCSIFKIQIFFFLSLSLLNKARNFNLYQFVEIYHSVLLISSSISWRWRWEVRLTRSIDEGIVKTFQARGSISNARFPAKITRSKLLRFYDASLSGKMSRGIFPSAIPPRFFKLFKSW